MSFTGPLSVVVTCHVALSDGANDGKVGGTNGWHTSTSP